MDTNKDLNDLNIEQLWDLDTQEQSAPQTEPEPEQIMPEPVEADAQEPEQKDEQAKAKSILLYLHDIIYLLAVVMVLTLLFVRIVVVSGTSMYDTLLDGDYLLVLSNSLYHNPKQGDIVVVSKQSFDNGKPIVKRVIATEGQTVDIDFTLGIVYVDGVALEEDYAYTATTLKEGVSFPLTVEEGCIFVLGDNRAKSHDSRAPDIGQIAEEEVMGKVVFLFLPGTNGTDVYGQPNEKRDWSRIGVVS